MSSFISFRSSDISFPAFLRSSTFSSFTLFMFVTFPSESTTFTVTLFITVAPSPITAITGAITAPITPTVTGMLSTTSPSFSTIILLTFPLLMYSLSVAIISEPLPSLSCFPSCPDCIRIIASTTSPLHALSASLASSNVTPVLSTILSIFSKVTIKSPPCLYIICFICFWLALNQKEHRL